MRLRLRRIPKSLLLVTCSLLGVLAKNDDNVCLASRSSLEFDTSPVCLYDALSDEARLDRTPEPSVASLQQTPDTAPTISLTSSAFPNTKTLTGAAVSGESTFRAILSSTVTLDNTLASSQTTAFLSFAEWRERQEQILGQLQSSLRKQQSTSVVKSAIPDQLPTNQAKQPLTESSSVDENDESPSFASLDGSMPNEEDVELQAVGSPIRYIQPLALAGSGAPEDPLVSLSARTNYASVDCSAAVLKSSKSTKGATSILNNAKDRYMLTPCSSKEKFVVIELCEEVNIDTLVLANFEFFSSMFKHFTVEGSEVYPGSKADWITLGTFRAGNVRGPQAFKPPRAGHFFKYLRVDFSSHYGNEHYCPVSLLRVYGKNQMEAFRDEEAARISESIIAAEFEPITEPEIVVVNLHSHNFVTVDSMQALTMANSETELSIVRQEISTAHPASSTTTFGEPVSTNHQQTADLIASPTKSHTIVASSQAQMGSSTSSSFPTVSVSSVLESSLSMTTNLQTGLQDATLLDSATQNTSLISKSTANKPVPSPNTVSISHSRPHLQPHQPLTSGESIYGAITKRLNSLEREVILTLRYVEEQGRIFQDIFARLESKLVETEVTRLKNEQNLRRLSLEMDFHRARVEEERIAMANQVNVLAEEILFGKRLNVVQLIALLAILVLVAVTRGATVAFAGLPYTSGRKLSLFGSSSPEVSRMNTFPSTALSNKAERVSRNAQSPHVKSPSIRRRSKFPASPIQPDRGRSGHRQTSSLSKLRAQTPPPRLETTPAGIVLGRPTPMTRQPLATFDINTNLANRSKRPDLLRPPSSANEAEWTSAEEKDYATPQRKTFAGIGNGNEH